MDMVGENMMFAWLHTYIGLSTKVLYERFYNKLLYSGFSWGGFLLSGFFFFFGKYSSKIFSLNLSLKSSHCFINSCF